MTDRIGKSWMPKAAGIIDIVVGSLVIIFVFATFAGATRAAMAGIHLFSFLTVIVLLCCIWGGISIIRSGVFALQCKKYETALMGSALAIAILLIGIIPTIFVILSKGRFKQQL